MSKKYIYKDVAHRKDGLVFTEIGPSPQGGIIFVSTTERGHELAHVLTPSYVAKNMIEYREPRKGTVWVNINKDTYNGQDNMWGYIHSSRELADKKASTQRIACLEVPWVEGQGLEQKCACLNKQRCEC